MAFIKYHNMGQVCEFELSRGQQVLFGRSQHADFELQDAAVSRKHFSIQTDESGAYIIQDLGSHNGTRVNNAVLHDEKLALKNGDEIQLTNYSFHFINTEDQYRSAPKVTTLAAQDANDTADFDDSTVAFARPVTDAVRERAFSSMASSAADEEKWTRSIREYAQKIADKSGHFECSYKEMARECDSFPVTGEVVAEKLIAKNVIALVGKEIVLSSGKNPGGGTRKIEVLTWALIK